MSIVWGHLFPELQDEIILRMTPLQRALLSMTSSVHHAKYGMKHELSTDNITEKAVSQGDTNILDEILSSWVAPFYQLDQLRLLKAVAQSDSVELLRYIFDQGWVSVRHLNNYLESICHLAGSFSSRLFLEALLSLTSLNTSPFSPQNESDEQNKLIFYKPSLISSFFNGAISHGRLSTLTDLIENTIANFRIGFAHEFYCSALQSGSWDMFSHVRSLYSNELGKIIARIRLGDIPFPPHSPPDDKEFFRHTAELAKKLQNEESDVIQYQLLDMALCSSTTAPLRLLLVEAGLRWERPSRIPKSFPEDQVDGFLQLLFTYPWLDENEYGEVSQFTVSPEIVYGELRDAAIINGNIPLLAALNRRQPLPPIQLGHYLTDRMSTKMIRYLHTIGVDHYSMLTTILRDPSGLAFALDTNLITVEGVRIRFDTHHLSIGTAAAVILHSRGYIQSG